MIAPPIVYIEYGELVIGAYIFSNQFGYLSLTIDPCSSIQRSPLPL